MNSVITGTIDTVGPDPNAPLNSAARGPLDG